MHQATQPRMSAYNKAQPGLPPYNASVHIYAYTYLTQRMHVRMHTRTYMYTHLCMHVFILVLKLRLVCLSAINPSNWTVDFSRSIS